MMHFQVSDILDGVSQFSFRTGKLRSDCLNIIGPACKSAQARGIGGVIFDLSQVGAIPNGALAALIEAVGRFRQLEFAFVGISGGALRRLARTGLDRHIHHFATCRAALEHPGFRRFALCKTHAILSLCPQPDELSALFGTKSLAEFDILGHPIIAHQLQNLAVFGVRTAFLDVPRYLVPTIKPLLAKHHNGVQPFICTQPDSPFSQSVQGHTGTNLSPHLRDNLGERNRYLTIAADALWRGRLDRILFAHLASQRTTTRITSKCGTALAKFCGGEELLHPVAEQSVKPIDIAISTPTGWLKRKNDILPLLRLASKRAICELPPNGEEIEQNLWRAPGADISPRARIQGFCYAGQFSSIEADAHLNDFNVLYKHARVERFSRSENCLVLPETTLKTGTSHRNLVVGTPVATKATITHSPKSDRATTIPFASAHALGSAA